MTKRLRINFGVSQYVRDWIITQKNIIGIFEESDKHVVVYHNMTTWEKSAFKNNLINNVFIEDMADV